MDHPVHDRAIIIADEDRISNLPDDIIHHFLSFLDMTYAIGTSTLSKKWKHIWISMPVLNFNSQTFRTLPKFAKFVKHVLSHRNHDTQVSAVELSFRGAPTQFVVKSIVKYAYLHNVRQLTLLSFGFPRKDEFPQCVFSSHTLKHLTLASNLTFSGCFGCGSRIPNYAWDFPALETLYLSNMILGDHGDKSLNLFSKCVNLKCLTLLCSMFAVDVFNVCALQLSDLTITYSRNFPKAFNVVAPQLKNLTATVNEYYGSFLQLCTEGLDSLEKVNLSLQTLIYGSYSKEEMDAPQLLDLFQKLQSAKFLTLNMGVIEVLSKRLDLLSLEPCAFNNLKCLKIEAEPPYNIPRTIAQVRSYLLESSPSATFIMDIPQLPKKRSRQQVDKGKKVAKMDEEIQQQDEVIAALP